MRLVLLVAFVATIVIGAVLQNRADEVCRARARDPNNVTLCRGEAYAIKIFGEVECRCSE